MTENRKYILDRFEAHIYEHYKAFCKRQNLSQSLSGFITFLIDQEIVPHSSIKKYTVIHEYENLTKNQKTQKTRAVFTLADRFNISERSVWGILKKDRNA